MARGSAALLLSLMLSLDAAAQEEPLPDPPPDTDQDGIIDSAEVVGDTDADGINDVSDPDDDGDGVHTKFELTVTSGDDSAFARDTDGDRIWDHLDNDDDGDGLPTADEAADPNHDGNPADAVVTAQQQDSPIPVPDYLNADDDADGVPTLEERANGDSDLDATPDYLDDDDDNDGVRKEPLVDTDADGKRDHRDPDDDDDGVPSLVEGPMLLDTDVDGILDMLDPDDDGDGIPTKDELGTGTAPRDTDTDGVPDYREADDDADTLPTSAERVLGDRDDDGRPDFLDRDDDGDGIATDIERGFSEDPDRDGVPNWYDLDSDGDGLTDFEEGVGDDDGDGLPNFVDPLKGGLDAGPGADAGIDAGSGGGTGSGDSGVIRVDAGAAPSDDGGGDSGCAIAPGPRPESLAWLSVLGLGAWFARRRRARALAQALSVVLVLGLGGAGCDSGDAEPDGGSFDAGPRLDAGKDAGRDTGVDAALSDAQLASECVVEGEPLIAQIEEPDERAWAATMIADTVHVVYVARVCGGVGNASGTRIDHVSFRSTGAYSAVETVAQDSDGDCRLRRSPALTPSAEGGLSVYYTASLSGSYELYRHALTAGAIPFAITSDGAGALDDELFTSSAQFGDGPLLAYVNRATPSASTQLVTRRPGAPENEIVALAQDQSATRLALLALPGGVGGALGWVTERGAVRSVRMTALNAAGVPNGSTTELSASAGPLSAIAFAANDKLGAVVYVAQSGKLGELRFRRLDGQGMVAEREVKLSSADRSISSPSVAVYTNGFVAAFREVPVETEGMPSFRLMFLSDTGAIAGERRIADATLSGGSSSQVFVASDGRLVVLWSDYGASGAQLHGLRLRCL